jgi:sugar phosphate isomerase/epimerase
MMQKIKWFFEPIIGKKKPSYLPGISLGRLYGDTVMARIAQGARMGVKMLEPFVEAPDSISKRDEAEIKKICSKFGVQISMHAGNLPLTVADKDVYKDVDEILRKYIEKAAAIKAKYVLFHSSIQLRPRYREAREMVYAHLVDENGEKITTKLHDERTWEWFKDYWLKDRISPDVLREKIAQKIQGKEIPEEEVKKIEREITEELCKQALKRWEKEGCRYLETLGYEIMARWMYFTGDGIWKAICGNRSPEDVSEEKRDAAVAAKYLQGHLMKVRRLAERKGVKIAIENTHGDPADIKYRRLTKPEHIFPVIQSLNSKNIGMTIDFEHLMLHGITPEDVIENYPPGIGRYIFSLHVCTPTPAHAHLPISRGDVYLYDLIWKLRLKDFKKGIIVFEPGGEKEEAKRVSESIIALKDMIKYLEQHVPPHRLPEGYLRIRPEDLEHEKRIIESHAFEPMRGFIESAELTHSWLRREVPGKKRRTLEEWLREEHR